MQARLLSPHVYAEGKATLSHSLVNMECEVKLQFRPSTLHSPSKSTTRSTSQLKNIFIHSSAALRSSSEPPTSSRLPSRSLNNFASPQEAMSSGVRVEG